MTNTNTQNPATPAQSVPAGGGEGQTLLDEMRAFINLIKGAALQGEGFFTTERRKQMFEECVRLNELYLAAPLQPQDGKDARTDSVHLGSGASGGVRS